MVIDLDKCTACQACTVACKVENNVPHSSPLGALQGRAMFWQQVLRVVEGEGHHVRASFLPRPCMHCENPPCVQVCPVGATYKRGDGIVAQDYDRCIGCRYCMTACPYGVRVFNWFRAEFPETMEQYLSPSVRVRPVGVVEKCTFCVHRIDDALAEGKKIGTSVGVVPACAQTCTGGAIYFGDLEDEHSLVHQLMTSPRSFRLLEDLGTRPQVIYLKEG